LSSPCSPRYRRKQPRAGKNGGGESKVDGISWGLPESNAEGLEILSNYYPGYWWDHTQVTIAVQAHPNATQEQLAAVEDAIATWDEVLRDSSTD
jgi:hypothetical protein